MARKPRPKYPNRERVILRRFLSQLLVLILGIGLALFYVLFNDAGEEQDVGAADAPAAPAALQEDGQKPKPPPGVAPPKKEREKTAPAAKPSPAPGSAAPARQKSGQKAGQQKSGQKAVAAPAPYADKTLDQVGAALAGRFKGRAPAAWGERLEGIATKIAVPGNRGPTVALTLDACGGKKGESYDKELIAFLRQNNIPATLFVTSLWLRTNPDTLRELAADPLFEIAAHGARHRPCSVSGKSVYGIKGTANFKELAEEVEGNLRDIEQATGSRPRWFRSGTAYYDDVAVEAISALGPGIAGYSIAGDEGATLPAAKVAAKVLTARHGDILLCHMNKPQSGTRQGLMTALPQLLQRGYRFVRLSDAP